MFTLYSENPQLIFHPFYSKHEAIDTPCNQRSEKTLDWFLIHRTEVVSIKMRPKNQTRRRITTEANRNISQQQKMIERQQQIVIDSLANKINMFQLQWDQIIKQ